MPLRGGFLFVQRYSPPANEFIRSFIGAFLNYFLQVVLNNFLFHFCCVRLNSSEDFCAQKRTHFSFNITYFDSLRTFLFNKSFFWGALWVTLLRELNELCILYQQVFQLLISVCAGTRYFLAYIAVRLTALCAENK